MNKNTGNSSKEGQQGSGKGRKAKARCNKGADSLVTSADGGSKKYSLLGGGGAVVRRSGVGGGDSSENVMWKSELEVESPLKWLRDYVEKIPQHPLDLAGSVKMYLDRIYNQNRFVLGITEESGVVGDHKADEDEATENFIETSDGQYVLRIAFGSHEWTAAWLCIASIFAYKGSYDRAAGLVGKLRYLSKTTADQMSESHQKAYRYLMDASSKTALGLGSFRPSDGTNTKSNAAIIKFPEGANLYRRWTELKEDPKCVAVILFVRGHMASMLNLADDIALTRFRKCALLEPDYYMWHGMVYRKLHQMRKLGGANANSSGPNSEEMEASKKAYELSPKLPVNVYNYAVMKKEKLLADMVQSYRGKALDKRGDEDLERLVNSSAVIELLEDVLNLTPHNSQTAMQAHLQLVELYTAKGLDLDERLAKDTIERCVRQWPSSSMVLHKAGKFYQNGGSTGRFKDPERAKEMYQKAVQLCPRNYPCLVDGLKHFGKLYKQHDPMIAMINRCINSITAPHRIQYLMALKGVCLWLHRDNTLDKKLEACRSWLDAVRRYPWMADKVAGYILVNSNEVFGQVKIHPDDVAEHIYSVCNKEKICVLTSKPVAQLLNGLEEEKKKRSKFYKPQRSAQGNQPRNPNGGCPNGNVMSCFNTKSKSKRLR